MENAKRRLLANVNIILDFKIQSIFILSLLYPNKNGETSVNLNKKLHSSPLTLLLNLDENVSEFRFFI